MKYRFTIDALPADPNQQLVLEDLYVHLRKGYEAWEILGTAGSSNKDGSWEKGGYTITGDIDDADKPDDVIALVREAVRAAKSATAAQYAADRHKPAGTPVPTMTITVFPAGKPESKTQADI